MKLALLACCALIAARLPVLGASVRILPLFVRDLAVPAAAAAAFTVVRVDGRTFHHAARATIAFWASHGRTTRASP